MTKLDYYGIRGSPLNWFESFLTHDTQSVVIDGASLAPVVPTSGVPPTNGLRTVTVLNVYK